MNYHRTVLENGLRVLTIPMPSFESATALVLVGAGSRYENRQNTGISHFLEHMAFKGTKKRPSAMHISSLIDGIGGEFNAFTGKETTGYYIKSAAAHVDLSLDLLSDMLSNSLFDKTEIEKEKGVILEEINLYEDTPMRKIGDIYERLLYGDTPLGWDIAGEKDVIRSIKREDFIFYMQQFYSAHNMTVVVAGGIDNKKAVDLAGKYFGKMKRFDVQGYSAVVESKSLRPEVLVKEKKTEQVHIALGFRTVPIDHPDKYPLSVLSAILGGGMSSRLFHEVREKRGLAYYVRTNSEHYQDAGNVSTASGVDPKRVDDAIKVIVEQYHTIVKPGNISKEELKKAKEFLKGHLVLELEDSRAVAGFYGSQELLEKQIDNVSEALSKVDAITDKDVEKVAKEYIEDKPFSLAVIGNFTDGQRFQKLLT